MTAETIEVVLSERYHRPVFGCECMPTDEVTGETEVLVGTWDAHVAAKVVEALGGRAHARPARSADLDYDALAALEQAATPGPWWHADPDIGPIEWEVLHDWQGEATTVVGHGHEADAALIAALRNAAPALIAAARNRDGMLGRLREVKLERDAARAETAALRERVEAVMELCDEDTHDLRSGVPGLVRLGDLRAALTTGGDRG